MQESEKPKLPIKYKYTYGDDADGNRGQKITEILCPGCKSELDTEEGIPNQCEQCGQGIELA